VLRLGSVCAMLSALRDPYTAYLTPPSYRLRHGSSVVGLDAAKPLNRVVR